MNPRAAPMRVLVLSKRQYTGRDLLDDRFGRVFEMPAVLAHRGHSVHGIALSYRHRREGEYRWDDIGRLTWTSVNLGLCGRGLYRYLSELRRTVQQFKPDVVWATSDAYQAIVGSWISRKSRIPLVVDFYDNYESFLASRVPGAIAGLRAASRRAAALTVVSATLAEWMVPAYRLSRSPVVIGNAVDPRVFFPRDRLAARRQLGLPEQARVVGVAGALTKARGIADVFEAFVQLAAADPELWFAMAGPRDNTTERFPHSRIRDLGILTPSDVPVLLSALDVAVVSNIDSAFGRYCFPQKLFEAIACGTPLVAARVGEVARILSGQAQAFYEPGDVGSLVQAIRGMLASPSSVSLSVPTWQERGEQLEAVLLKHLQQGKV